MKIKSNLRILWGAAALLVTGFAQAQETTTTTTVTTTSVTDDYEKGWRLGFGLNGGYMFNQPFENVALGADARLQYDLSKRLSVTLTTGYNHFMIDDRLDNLGFCDVGQIPVKAGFKAFFWEDQFYAMGEAGAGFTVSKNKPVDNTTVILAPSIGWANKWLDISARYEHYTEFETGQVALRIAYGFKL